MKKKIKEILNFLSNVLSVYCLLILIMFSFKFFIEVPLVGVPFLLISLVMQIIEKSKDRGK